MSDVELLERYKPVLLMDSAERFFAESIDGEPDVVYGRMAVEHGERWLQFWAWFRSNRALFGNHAGDWEGQQFLLQGDTPILAVYATHGGGDRYLCTDVELDGRPRVYVARGTHASYGRAGWHRRSRVLWERSDGKGRRVDPRVEVMPETGWSMRPEHWGEDKHSPSSPGRQWRFHSPSTWARSEYVRNLEGV